MEENKFEEKPDWDTAVQRELFYLKRNIKKQEKQIQDLKDEFSRERDRAYRKDREISRLREQIHVYERNEEKKKREDRKKKEWKEREESIIRETKLRVKVEQQERARFEKLNKQNK